MFMIVRDMRKSNGILVVFFFCFFFAGYLLSSPQRIVVDDDDELGFLLSTMTRVKCTEPIYSAKSFPFLFCSLVVPKGRGTGHGRG